MKPSTLKLFFAVVFFELSILNFIVALWGLSVLHLAISILWFIGGVLWIEIHKDTKDLEEIVK